MTGEIDVSKMQDATPKEAPVGDPNPLTGKEKAGVSLTWGIIVVLVFFLLIILIIFWWGEYRYIEALNSLENLKITTPAAAQELKGLIESLGAKQESFRSFWFNTLQLILLNILFPTLTALLGYVFGTSKGSNS